MLWPARTARAEKPVHRARGRRLRILALGALVACLSCVALMPPSAFGDSVVTFPDAGLNGAVHNALGKALADPIEQSDLTTLTVLHADGWSITNLDGLEHATGLQMLTLDDNSITTITPLASLTNLTWLELEGNNINDLDPLKNLTGLETLVLNSNQISDVGPLKNLTGLTDLELAENSITDVDALKTLTGLTQLALGSNHLANVTPIASLTNLTWLDIRENQVTDISSLATLTKLGHLFIGNNSGLSDLGSVASMTNLTYLDLSSCNVTTITPLSGLSKLAWLAMGGNHIANLAPVNSIHTLTMLEAQLNDIGDVSPLAGLTNLTQLYLGGNHISDVTAIGGLTKLTYLYLWGNHISNVAPLATLNQLHWLQMQGNDVWDVTPLAHVPLNKVADFVDNWLDVKPGSATSQTADAWIAAGLLPVNLYLTPQKTCGRMVGTVRSTRGALLSGAVVALSFGPSASTGPGGTYAFPVVPTYDQTITVSKLRYTSVTATRSVSAGVTQTVDVTLAPILSTPTLMRLPRSASLSYQRKKGVAKFTLSATLTDHFGPVAAAFVWLQKSSNGRKWSTLYKLKTDSAGKVSRAFSVRKKGTTYYRWCAPATEVDRLAATGKQKVAVK